MDIVQRECLTFVSPLKWKDTYEGFLFRKAKNTLEKGKIIKEFEKIMPKMNAEASASLLINEIFAYFCQCWTTIEESDVFWRIYSHDSMSIRIEIKFEDALKLEYVTTEEVKYFSKLELEKEIQNIIWPDWESIIPYKALLSKREAFHHEHEVRLILADYSNLNHVGKTPFSSDEKIQVEKDLASGMNSWLLTKDDAERMFSLITDYKKPATSIQISIKEIPNFIKSVMLHPDAPNWFDETLAEFCKRNNIKYLGKSQLYELDLT